jgi:hypothetical protein
MARRRRIFGGRIRYIAPPELEHYRFVRLPATERGDEQFEIWRGDTRSSVAPQGSRSSG